MPEMITTSILTETLTLSQVFLCSLVSLLCGLGIAATYMFKNTFSKGFAITLALLPCIVQIVIMMVNGNLGAGVAVAGAFSLVRFRSVPGSARDIASIFLAMAIGLATGMGYLFYALVFFLLLGGVSMLLFSTRFGEAPEASRTLRITIPENLDYETLFDDLLARYTRKATFEQVRLTNMGSLYELSYCVTLKDPGQSKAFLDEIRCRNGNLNIVLSRPQATREAL